MKPLSTFVRAAAIMLISLGSVGVVHASKVPPVLDLYRHMTAKDGAALERRQSSDGDVPLPIKFTNDGYSAVLEFGIPPVSITLGLTAASSDTWVNIANSTFCLEASNDCSTYGYCESHTQHIVWESNNFSIAYYGDTSVNGSWFTDTVQIGTQQFYNAQFAVANESEVAEGFLGLGYFSDESATTHYPNFPYLLYQNNYIECNAWSIWLDPVNQSTGQLIFGGIDSDKFLGPLETFSVQPTGLGDYENPIIVLADMRLVYDGKNTSLANGKTIQVLPDAGENYSSLPQDFFDALVHGVTGSRSGISCSTPNATCFEDSVQMCDCSLLDNSTTVDFVFDSTHGSIAFELPMSEVIYNTEGTCYFAFLPTNDSGNYILGANFLRATYVVYDFLHNEVSMAPTNKKPTSSKIQVIPSAGVAAAAFQGVTASSATSRSSSTATYTGSAKSSTAADSSGLSTGAKAGIGVGVPIGVLLLLSLGAWLLLRRRRRSQSAAAEIDPHAPPVLQNSEKEVAVGRVVSAEIHAHSAGSAPAINSEPQELAAAMAGQDIQYQHQQQRALSDLSTSDHYASTAVGSANSPNIEHGVHELDSDGRMPPSGVRRKPVGSG